MFLLFFSSSVLHICGYFPRHSSDFSSQVTLCVLLTVGREGRDSPTYWLSCLRRLCVLPRSGWWQGPFVCWSPGSRSGWFRGPPWGEGSSQVVWSLRLTNPIPVVPGACCRGPSSSPGSQAHRSRECVNGTATLTRVERMLVFGRPSFSLVQY